MADFNISIPKVLVNEGGLSNDKNDSGGLTNFGISQTSYPNEDIRNLTVDRAKFLYERDYWNPIMGNSILNQDIADSLFDFAVNAGVGSAVKLAQGVVGTVQDGAMGPKTISAINIYSPELFLAKFKLSKIQKYVNICMNNSSQKVFFFGWIVRALK